jgi:hypothetical protein
VARLEEIISAPRDMIVVCPDCGNDMLIKPPVADDMRLKVIDLLARYGVGTKKGEEEGTRYVLVMDI